jgi:hypothetical protein
MNRPHDFPSAVPRVPDYWTLPRLLALPQVAALDEETRFAMQVVGSVFAVRANSYVLEQLIDWDAAPADPIFRMIFLRREMLGDAAYEKIARAHRRRASVSELAGIVRTVRDGLNPHPAGQDVFVLRFLQGRDPRWAHRPFFAQFDEDACWIDELKPAFGAKRFFFESE